MGMGDQNNPVGNENRFQGPNNQIDDELQQRFKELKKLIGEQAGRIHNLQASAFQLANYYFVFQGVILAAISNGNSLVCSDAWFVFLLSLLAAVLNFFALLSIGTKYIRAMNLHDNTWSEYSDVKRRLLDRAHEGEANNNEDRQEFCRVDNFSQGRRRVILIACLFLFVIFTGVTLSGPWAVICRHDKKWRQHQKDSDCFKLCNGSRCMMFCNEKI